MGDVAFIIQLKMFSSSEIVPFYVLFQGGQVLSTLLSLQPFLPQTNLVSWGAPLASTHALLQPEWPQNIENFLPKDHPSPHQSLPTAATLQEEQVKPSRRAKNKRVRNSEKQLQSAKKNSESNIVNQLYSFFNSYEKSEEVVEGAIRLLGGRAEDQEKIKSMFYSTVRLINYKRGRKYVNKANILHYYTPRTFLAHLPDIQQKLAQVNILTLEQLCFLFRVTTNYFIRNVSVSAILTSKRISVVATWEHLSRRRKVLRSFSENH